MKIHSFVKRRYCIFSGGGVIWMKKAKMRARTFTHLARACVHGSLQKKILVVTAYLMSLSLKYYKDPFFC